MLKFNMFYDFAIVGSGISGLTAAFWLKKNGMSLCVIEREKIPGGSIKTIELDGFLLELGPNTVLDNSPYIKEIVDALKINESFIYAKKINKKRYIFKEGKLIPLPSNPFNFFFSDLFSLKTKLRIFKEPFIKPSEKEETISEFTKRRLGEEILNFAVGPFVSGVYAGDPEKLSVQWATKKIYALEKKYGSLIRGAIAKRRGPSPSKGIFSFKKGLYELIENLASFVENLFLETEVKEIIKEKDFYLISCKRENEVLEIKAKSIILTGDSISQWKILNKLSPKCPFNEIPYAGVILIFFGFKREDIGHPLDGFGFLVPQIYKKPLLGCLFSSSLFDGRAPKGYVLLTCFLGGELNPYVFNLSREDLIEYALKELTPVLKVKGKPEFLFLKKWERAIPQYYIGHKIHIDWASNFESFYKNFYISGNLLNGISVADCITNSTELVLKKITGI